MPANIAMEIARSPDGDVERALADAYENKLLPGNQVLAIRRIIQRRDQRRKSPPRRGRGVPHTGKITAAALIESYQDEALQSASARSGSYIRERPLRMCLSQSQMPEQLLPPAAFGETNT
jgi:ParB family chromosome partitioning protein